MSSRVDRATALERARSARGASRPTPFDALRVARHRWVADGRIDMRALASELGVSRATLYNWVGDKDRLTAEVLWSMAEAALARSRDAAQGRGAAYLADVTERYLEAVAEFGPLRAFITRDPETALRVLTTNRTAFQRRFIGAVQELIEAEMSDGCYEPPLAPDTLAYLLVRIGESFIYSDVITGTDPDLAKAAEASRVLLHARPVGSATAR